MNNERFLKWSKRLVLVLAGIMTLDVTTDFGNDIAMEYPISQFVSQEGHIDNDSGGETALKAAVAGGSVIVGTLLSKTSRGKKIDYILKEQFPVLQNSESEMLLMDSQKNSTKSTKIDIPPPLEIIDLFDRYKKEMLILISVLADELNLDSESVSVPIHSPLHGAGSVQITGTVNSDQESVLRIFSHLVGKLYSLKIRHTVSICCKKGCSFEDGFGLAIEDELARPRQLAKEIIHYDPRDPSFPAFSVRL